MWIAKERLPFSTVESPHFKKFIRGGSHLKRTQLVDTYLPAVLDDTIQSVRKSIGAADFRYSITSDGWTTSANKAIHWSATTLHFINAELEVTTFSIRHWRLR